jgi:hypothetical protein
MWRTLTAAEDPGGASGSFSEGILPTFQKRGQDEPSAAQVQLDTSGYPPLIRVLYEATREAREQQP